MRSGWISLGEASWVTHPSVWRSTCFNDLWFRSPRPHSSLPFLCTYSKRTSFPFTAGANSAFCSVLIAKDPQSTLSTSNWTRVTKQMNGHAIAFLGHWTFIWAWNEGGPCFRLILQKEVRTSFTHHLTGHLCGTALQADRPTWFPSTATKPVSWQAITYNTRMEEKENKSLSRTWINHWFTLPFPHLGRVVPWKHWESLRNL